MIAFSLRKVNAKYGQILRHPSVKEIKRHEELLTRRNIHTFAAFKK
jgi:hypothetical protein